jgi:hypothetical protein
MGRRAFFVETFVLADRPPGLREDGCPIVESRKARIDSVESPGSVLNAAWCVVIGAAVATGWGS